MTDPETGGSEQPPTVLQQVSRKTGDQPKVMLRDSDGEETVSPYVDPKAKDALLSPKGRGNYQILGEIARGGMGVVFKGRDTDLGRDVAVKVLDRKLLDNPAVLQRFVEEAQIGGQLQHPGVVPVYEMGMMADERPYFTMKLIKGRTLAALLNRRKSLETDRRRFLSIFESVCQTVAYAHSKGVIHRDLKPANVMVGAFGEVQVVDWGLAKVLGGGGVVDEMAAKQTQFTIIETVRSGPGSDGSDSVVGSVMGTPAYMPPEQAQGEIAKVDERSDVFSLGGILCEIITGKPPYVSGEETRTVVLAAQAKIDPARERIEACQADEELKALCLECLSVAPVARPENAEEVAGRIHAYLAALEERAHKAELAATEAREQRRRQRLTLALAGTVVFSLVAIGGVVRYLEKDRLARDAQQLASAGQALDDAVSQVGSLQEEGRFDEALEVARASMAVLDSTDVRDTAMRERGQRLVDQASARVAEKRAEEDLARRNAVLLERCSGLRMQQIEALFGFSPRNMDQTIENDYALAFRDYGIDIGDDDLPAAMKKLRSSGIAVEAALALDDWASVRRRIYGPDTYEVEAVLALAFDLDPDPLRTRMREVILTDDKDAILELALTEDLSGAPPSTFWVLSQALSLFKLDDQTSEIVRQGVERHPDDFLLNFRLGHIYANANFDRAAIRYLSVAAGLQPDNAAVHAILGDAFNDVDVAAAKRSYSKALELSTAYKRIHRFVGWHAFLSGDYETAVAAYERVDELFPGDTEWKFEGNLARSFAGELPMSELVDGMAVARRDRHLLWIAWSLAVHPDPAQRDPELALELALPLLADRNAIANSIVASAYLELGEYGKALETIDAADGTYEHWDNDFRATMALNRAWAFHGLGDRDEAREQLDVAEKLTRALFYAGEEPWEGSPSLRLLREIRVLVR